MSEAIGTVVRIDAKRCHVDIEGEVHLLPPRGKLYERKGAVKNPIAVGDRVRVELTDDEEGGSVEEVLPRRSKLARASAGEGSLEQVLVANVDQVLVVSAIRDPLFRPQLVDRILLGCERSDLDAIVIINKADREKNNASGEESIPHWVDFYSSLGYRAFGTSVVDGRGVDQLRELLRDRISVFCGLSGVGKSSLLNAVQPGLALRVGKVSKRGAREGRHTTTHSALLRLQDGGYVVDTPGIRNFGLFGLDARELPELFPEFRPHLGGCGFDDCSHTHEPKCAIKTALEAGSIAPSRYASYEELLAECEQGRL